MSWMAKVSLILIFTVIFCIIALSGFGANDAAADTHYSRVTGTWATAATFSTVACGGVAAAAAPAATDDVVICAGNTVTLGAAAQITNITINSTGILAGSTFLLTVTGNYTNNGTHSGSGGATLSGAAMTIDGTGLVTNTGTFTISGTKTIASTASLTFSGPVTCTAAVTNSGTISVAGIFTATGVTFTNNGTVTLSNTGAGALAGTGGFTQGASSTLNYAGSTITITTFTPTGAGNTVNYSAAGQTVRDVAYVNLTTSGSGTKTWTLTAARAMTGNISVGTGTNLTTAGNFTLSVAGTTNVTGTLTLGGTSGKTFTGAVTINSTGVWNETGVSTYAFAGGLTNNGTTFTANTGVHTFQTNNQAIGGTSATAIPSVTVTTITLTNNITTGAGLTVSTALAGTGGLTQGTNAVLTLGGTSAITTLTATAVGNTVNYNANGAQAACKVTTYNNLTLSVAGIKTFATTPTVNGILSIEGTATVVATAGVVTYGTNATLQYKTTDVRTVTLEEWLATTVATGGVIIANTAGSITLNAAKVFNNAVPLTINSGATLITNNNNLTLGGNWINNGGTFTVGTSTVLFNGTGNQSISGSNTWYNLQITTPGGVARTVTFASGATQTISNAAGSLTLTGASATQLLTLAPTVNGSAWLLNKNATITPTISNVSVSFSNASSGGQIDASTGANNSNAGNNTNWKFSATITSCVGCHGYKATFGDGTARNTPDGQFQGSHNEHVVTYSTACSVCHTIPKTETSADFGHRNSTVQIASPINGLAGSNYSKASFLQTNAAFSGGTCSNTYCHSNGTSATNPPGSIPNNTSATWGGTTACNSCHAAGGAADGRPYYAGGTPKANAHQAATHLAQTCDICHNSVTYSAGVYTPNTLHDNGAYNINTGMTYTTGSAALGGTCATPGSSCHGSINWGGTIGCVDCHSAAISSPTAMALDGAVTQRRAIVPEFGYTSSHVRSRGSSVTNADCGVCHMEGTASNGAINASYHKNGYVELRDPDTGNQIQTATWAGPNAGNYTTAAPNVSFVRFSRNLSSNTLETPAVSIMINQCLHCHDSGGATNALARVTGGSAEKPFATTIAGAGYTGAGVTANGVAGGVTDINYAFDTAFSSYHPIRGKQNNSYADLDTMPAPWDFPAKTGGTTTGWGYLMTCWDCHAPNAATGTQTSTVTAHGATPFTAGTPAMRGTIWVSSPTLCTTCHTASIYASNADIHGTATGVSAFNVPSIGQMSPDCANCSDCHFSAIAKPTRPTPGEDVHGFNKLKTTGANWPGANYASRPYAFIRNTVEFQNHRPLSSPEKVNTNGACNLGGTAPVCSHSNMPTTANDATATYTPGGVY